MSFDFSDQMESQLSKFLKAKKSSNEKFDKAFRVKKL